MSYFTKQTAREAWSRRLNSYWNCRSFPRFISRIGEIYEIDFGENVGTEFSGRHLAICLSNTTPSQEKMLVVPLSTKYIKYNIADEDVIKTISSNGTEIKAGVVLREAKWVSKIRTFRASIILHDPIDVDPESLPITKGSVELTNSQYKRWSQL